MRKITPSIMVQLILIFLVAGQLVTRAQEEDYRTYTLVGALQPYAGIAPDTSTGWLVADGSCISRSAYDQLFAVIGTIYGACDGTTTYALPNLRGRTLIGTGDYFEMDGEEEIFSQDWGLGQISGLVLHQLDIEEMPPHTHGIPRGSGSAGSGTGQISQNLFPSTINNAWQTSSRGGAEACSPGPCEAVRFSLMQPSMAINYLIWAGIEALAVPAEDVVITVVVVFPTHTPTPTLTPSMTPTDGPSPTPTPTASNTPSGNIPSTEYEVGGQTVVVQNLVTPGDAAIVGLLAVLVGLLIGAMVLKQRRRL